MTWVKLLDDGEGSSQETCEWLLSEGMMPVVRIAGRAQYPANLGEREARTIRRLAVLGVRYFELGSEPDSAAQWDGGRLPELWLLSAMQAFLADAELVLAAGGLPGFPAFRGAWRENPLEKINSLGRSDLFEQGLWLALHNRPLNRPAAYPFDPANFQGAPVTEAEYAQHGEWAWEGDSRSKVNQRREAGRQPRPSLAAAQDCFLSWAAVDAAVLAATGRYLPLITTEGGPVIGSHEDLRYPRTTPQLHAEQVASIDEFMQGRRMLGPVSCPTHYLASCNWLLANYRLGSAAPGFESQAWYSDWWASQFGLRDSLPAAALWKERPAARVNDVYCAEVAGRLRRNDTGDGLAGIALELREGQRLVAKGTSSDAGSFSFPRLRPGPYDLYAGEWGLVQQVQARHPARPSDVYLPAPSTSTLGGRLHAPDGAPAAGVTVSLAGQGQALERAITASDGTFRFSALGPGRYDISVPGITVAGLALDGWGSKSVRLTLFEPGGSATRADSVAQAGGTPPGWDASIEGHALGAIPGTRVYVRDGVVEREATIRADGEFLFGDLPAGIFTLEMEGLGIIAHNITLAQGQLLRYLFPMRTRIDGQVQARAALPDGEAAVLYAPPEWGWTRQCLLDGEGRFGFDRLPAGSYRLRVCRQWLPEVAVNGDAPLVIPPLDLDAGRSASLRGRIRDAHGRAVTGAQVALHYDDDQRLAVVRTGDDGEYAFGGLPAGRYTVHGEANVQIGAAVALDGESETVRDLLWRPPQSRGELLVRVIGASGQPQRGMCVRLLRDGDEVRQAETGENGLVVFDELDPGAYALAIGEGEPLMREIPVAGGRSLEQELLLVPQRGKAIAHYLLFPPPVSPEARLALGLALDYVRASGSAGGFELLDACQAARVTLVGDGVPADAEITLRAAGCQVTRLAGSGYSLATAIEQLLGTAGEG